LTFLDVGRIAMAAKTDEGAWRHGLSLFGELKYAAQFARFAYVNPGAPKGGTARRGATGTYDNFNLIVNGLKGDLAAGTNLILGAMTRRRLPVISLGGRRNRPFHTYRRQPACCSPPLILSLNGFVSGPACLAP
jgi:hypothetical protein